MLSWRSCVLTAILSIANPLLAQDRNLTVNTQDVIAAFETATNAMTTFDVQVNVRTVSFFSEQVLVDGKPVPGWKDFKPHKVETAKSRQMYSRGFRRIENINSQSGSPDIIIGADNEIERVLSNKDKRGTIRRAGGPALDWGHDYQDSFRSVCSAIPMMLILRERAKIVKTYWSHNYMVIEVEPASGTYANYGFKIFADPTSNFLPAKVETFRVTNGERLILARMMVLKRMEVAPGLQVPIEVDTEFLSATKVNGRLGQPYMKVELRVDIEKSKWNKPIDNSAFQVAFPAGLLVLDEIREVMVVTGKADPGKNLEELAANSRVIIRNIRPPITVESRSWIWWSAGAMGVAFVATLWWLFRRRWSASSL
jgi:hypothetical protein